LREVTLVVLEHLLEAFGCRVQGAGCRVQGAGCRVQGAGCRVQGAGCLEGPRGGRGCPVEVPMLAWLYYINLITGSTILFKPSHSFDKDNIV